MFRKKIRIKIMVMIFPFILNFMELMLKIYLWRKDLLPLIYGWCLEIRNNLKVFRMMNMRKSIWIKKIILRCGVILPFRLIKKVIYNINLI